MQSRYKIQPLPTFIIEVTLDELFSDSITKTIEYNSCYIDINISNPKNYLEGFSICFASNVLFIIIELKDNIFKLKGNELHGYCTSDQPIIINGKKIEFDFDKKTGICCKVFDNIKMFLHLKDTPKSINEEKKEASKKEMSTVNSLKKFHKLLCQKEYYLNELEHTLYN
ncbi:hypothetical protein EHI8A_020690 [Entamoeba histolytica HM-1:IMSS-B]|uniref:Uncharacterized protein n=6 Tax=Entamoeba histolytica TaxID=5759 RepID=C4LYW7_ENTH1|nr:hypothetical protein EHI_117830 [Entamoeba histolytica HM-1:IMSS]EMD42731.1 Hypothetical protein EHI5A_002730 [Entamoeba histolytica KU27]EMH73189.1 hypothetical protein EHI8A_020690 [Entamoeba histolytica HM-1:IMSS-B]EMS15695.1 hypothetical protein KM1_003700 [Entamoeba histolytica HM-3:IMSS]ENY63353.1 hypothetical protein EHI7A_000560 [Entamoeba histolytica HM-1:IMSS-A]GAT94034.1 hypothetical protein CL6EHI_117830 [Entamoeba histolytica]|eukprot:XP_656073.1 hypothetical protein EHI_117830 [Entamoeba histolytica HM-1:IMSS]